MIEYRQKRKQGARIHHALSKVGGKEIDDVLPTIVVELESGNEDVSKSHEEGSSSDERSELAPTGHDDASNHASYERRKRWDDESASSPRCRFSKHNLEEERHLEEELTDRIRAHCRLLAPQETYRIRSHSKEDIRQLCRDWSKATEHAQRDNWQSLSLCFDQDE